MNIQNLWAALILQIKLDNLKNLAPPILYGIGDQDLLSEGGLAVVGSREVDEEGIEYTQSVAQTCAEQGIQIISGGARGVDQTAMLAAVEAGGTAVGVLAIRQTIVQDPLEQPHQLETVETQCLP